MKFNLRQFAASVEGTMNDMEQLARLHRTIRVIGLIAVLSLAGLSGATAAETVKGLKPLATQPDPTALKPGLAVTYYFNIFNFIREIREFAKIEKGVKGKPITKLDYMVGPGNVLTSGRANGVGADISGLIHLPKAGVYTIAMQSNDGVRLEIGGKLIISDPNVHADRFSQLVPVSVEKPGWYSLSVLYFEKRHTSTLELYWIKPNEDTSLKIVPAKALAHFLGN